MAVLLSNRSAAYAQYGKAEEALDDAEDCLRIKPKWGKAYGRKGKALFDLGRYREAKECYEEGIVLDSKNNTLRAGLVECELKIKEENDEYDDDKVENNVDVDDFLNEINELEADKKKKKEDEARKSRFTFNHKEQTKNWTTENQINRILSDKYEWTNINPFVVLAIPHTSTEHDINRRYKKLSQLLHPDKLKLDSHLNTVEAEKLKKRAENAFDQIQKAKGKLKNPKIRDKVLITIERITKRIKESRNRLMAKGLLEEELGDEALEIDIELKKEFATMEHKRLRSGTLKRKYEMRTKESKKREKVHWQKVKAKELAFREKREERIKEWQEFAQDGEKQKKEGFDYDKASNIKEDVKKKRLAERKTFKGFGVDELYKTDWR